jgi:hypothetical protein
MPRNQITIWMTTKHASNRQYQRKIPENSIRETVSNPDTQVQQRSGHHGGINWKFERQYGSRRLRVIAELCQETCYAITAFWT